jgi:hypothetical protein
LTAVDGIDLWVSGMKCSIHNTSSSICVAIPHLSWLQPSKSATFWNALGCRDHSQI